jgi:hypothetical protein
MLERLAHLIGGTMLLVGAFGIGWVLHRAFVLGDMAIGSPIAVITLVLSLGAIVVGQRLERSWDPASVLPEEPTRDEGTEEDFDPEASPLGDADLEKYERDESR